ncbi:unnamed protein product, partial [Symbiodinium sp. KB8]
MPTGVLVQFTDEESLSSDCHPSPSDVEHYDSASSVNTGTQPMPCGETVSSNVSTAAFQLSKPDVENRIQEAPCSRCLSIWTWGTCGLPLGGFFLAFLSSASSSIVYGFFLGYMGLDAYVLLSIQALMKLPQVLLLPFGMMNDCLPIFGYNRKPYFVASWILSGSALLIMSLRPLPAPYYCQKDDGSYDVMSPPCNPSIHDEKNWYVFPLFILTAGVQLGVVAGEGLLLEYSQREPLECRGKMKAEFTMVTMAGSLVSSAAVGVFMNGKEYLGTFDWGLSFSGFMTMCLLMVTFL